MIRLLITGANGFIGRHCLTALASSSAEIHGVTSKHKLPRNESIHWHTCNLLDADQSQRLIAEIRPTHLLHLAWVTTPGLLWTSPLNESWRAASLKLAESFVASGGERMICAGTSAEYDWSRGICLESEPNPNPPSPYAQAKARLSQDLAELASISGVGLAWPRLFWTYGPHESAERLMPSIILSLLNDRPAHCTAGTHRRDYLHVSDMARAIAALVPASLVGAVNIASGSAVSIASIATTIAAAMNKPHLLYLGSKTTTQAEAPLVVANIDRLLRHTAWRPQVSLESGLRDTIRWWTERCGFVQPSKTFDSRALQSQAAGEFFQEG